MKDIYLPLFDNFVYFMSIICAGVGLPRERERERERERDGEREMVYATYPEFPSCKGNNSDNTNCTAAHTHNREESYNDILCCNCQNGKGKEDTSYYTQYCIVSHRLKMKEKQ